VPGVLQSARVLDRVVPAPVAPLPLPMVRASLQRSA
jgi:hypothetical protein